ncbi:hypothetical protein RUM43_003873 [Polyplax serrata]|uniref:Phosphatidylcholine transfer protein n=1 Tax=Polyplax serrata TaxID=468196 RepID=A0AAN8P7A4_POLSC
MILLNFLSKNVGSIKMSRVTLLRLSQFLKAHPDNIRVSCLRNCECLLAYKLRRGQQVLNLYRNLWGEIRIKKMLDYFRQQLTPRRKMLTLAGSMVLFDWNKNRIDEKYMRSHYLDLDYINYLTKLTITCNVCQKRLVIDSPRPNVDYCTCSGTKPVYNKKFGTCPWMPFLEGQDLLIWRREQEHNPGMYEYKVYGFYEEVRADMFLQVQLDTEYRKTWDVTAVDIKLLDSDTYSNSNVLYWEMQWPKFFANRDYVFNRRYIIDPVEKVIVITNHITEHPSAPEDPQKFRVKDYKCTMVIRPTTTFDKPGVRFCMTYFDNPGLSIPGPIQTWVATAAMPDFLTRLRSASTRYSVSGNKTGTPAADEPCKGGFFKNFSVRHRTRGLMQRTTWVNHFKSYFLPS